MDVNRIACCCCTMNCEFECAVMICAKKHGSGPQKLIAVGEVDCV
jgi:hypothetical protein